MDNINIIRQRISDSIEAKQSLLADKTTIGIISSLAEKIVECISSGGKLVLCGNGGSASDALHFAGEIVGRFVKERKAWPAVVLNADVATMTATMGMMMCSPVRQKGISRKRIFLSELVPAVIVRTSIEPNKWQKVLGQQRLAW